MRSPSFSHHRQILFAWASSHSMRTLSAAGQTSDITLSCTKKTRDIALSQQIAVIISSSGLEIRFFLKVSKTHTASLWRKYYITKVLLKGRHLDCGFQQWGDQADIGKGGCPLEYYWTSGLPLQFLSFFGFEKIYTQAWLKLDHLLFLRSSIEIVERSREHLKVHIYCCVLISSLCPLWTPVFASIWSMVPSVFFCLTSSA